MSKKWFIFTVYMLFFGRVFSQLSVTPDSLALHMARIIVGPGIAVSNARLTGPYGSAGTFSGNNNTGIDSGIILTNGYANYAMGPNDTTVDQEWGTAGDTDLANAIGQPVDFLFDACALEFDMIVPFDSIAFNYVFGSEEYPDYVCSEFDDAFALFIRGAGITGFRNIALVPGTNIPVSINTVNDGSGPGFGAGGNFCNSTVYPQYFINNGTSDNFGTTTYSPPNSTSPFYMQYNGITRVMTASQGGLTPCTRYHLKLVISDVGDSLLDSGIFIKAGFGVTTSNNIVSLGVPYTTNANSTTAIVACSQGIIPVQLLYPTNTDTVIHFQIAGTGINGTDYTWVADSIKFRAGDSVKNIMIIPLPSGYTGFRTVSIIMLSPCGLPDTATINISNALSATVTSLNVPVCPGGTAILSATLTGTGGTYLWSPGGATTSSIAVTPSVTSLYSVTFTSQSCGSATATDTVTVISLPTVTLTVRNAFCSQPGVVIASPAGGYGPFQYAINGGAFQATDSFSGLAGGTYTVVVEDSLGCRSNPVVVDVATGTALSLMLTIDSITCSVSAGQIIAIASGGSGVYQYSLNGGAFQPSGNFGGLTVADDIVEAEDTQGCSISDTVNILQAGVVSVVAFADSAKCYNSPTGMIIESATGGSPPYQYALNGGAFQNLDTFTGLVAGMYSVIVKDAGSCQSGASVQVFQPDSLYITSVNPTAVKCVGDKNGTISISATGGTPVYTYTATTDSVNFESMTGNEIAGLDTGLYVVFLSDSRGCTLLTTAVIPDAIADTFSVVTDSTSCFGEQWKDGAIIVNGLVPQNAPYVYSLNGGAYQPSDTFNGLGAGTYQVVTQNRNGCTTDITGIVVGSPPASYAWAFPVDTSVKLGQNVQLQSYLTGGSAGSADITYLWSPSEGINCAYCQNPVATTYAANNVYTVLVTYNGYCTVSATINIRVDFTGNVYIPSAFSPNGDGNNDIFYIYGAEINHVDLIVFNRWGEKVFESHNQFWGWDGTYKNVLQMPSVFTYEANVYFLNGTSKSFKGSISLVR